MKTTLRKRIGAMALCIAMVLSMSAGFTTALAAEVPGAGGGALNSKPKLHIDFLGDNGGDGTITDPANAVAPTNTDWKYTPSHGTTDGKTIFWVGVGIDNIDEFVLANAAGEKGLASLELGFYYNSAYVAPYTGAEPGDDAAFLAAVQKANISASPTKNQWSGDYEVAAAVSAADPTASDKTGMTVNDPATQEYAPPAGWKMTYLSIHRTDSAVGPNRFADAKAGEAKYGDVQYVAMIPFVLTGIDTRTNPELCFRLALNAFIFSAGSGAKGHGVYGAWEKNTADDPEHNLKLMLDFTGDLNIFTGEKESDTYQASLALDKGGRQANTATLGIWQDPAPQPARIDKNGDVLTGLMGGTEMELKLACAKGFSVTVDVRAADDTHVYNKTYTATDSAVSYTEHFRMPDKSVTVSVTYQSDGGSDTEYTAKLGITHNTPANDGNAVVMSYTDDGGTAHSVNQNGDTLNLPSGKTVGLTVTTNSEYDVEIKITRTGDGSIVQHQVITDQKSYTFTMPSADVTASVAFTKAAYHEAKLVVTNEPADAANAANKAKLSYSITETPASVISTDEVFSGYTGGNDALNLRDGRIVTVTIPDTYDKAYAVKSVVVSPKNAGEFAAFDATAVTANEIYTFAMPKYDAEITVTFTKVQDYKVKLQIVGADDGCSAGLEATDARGQQQTDWTADPVKDTIAVFLNTTVNISATVPAGYSVKVSITRPNGDAIIPGGTAGAWNFVLNTAYADPDKDQTTVTVTFIKGEAVKYDATLDWAYDPIDTAPAVLNAAAWQGTTGSAIRIRAEEGDRLTGEINVAEGYYIQRVTGVADDGTAVPLTVSGNGYNNGAGTGAAPVTVRFAMPAGNVTVKVIYAKGAPPEEPGFQARLVLEGDAAGTGIPFELKSDGASAAPGAYFTAQAGETVTGIFRTAPDYYVTGVTAVAATAGVAVNWQWMPDGSLAFAMPASDVTVTVQVEKSETPPAFVLTLEKQEPSGAVVSGNTASLGTLSVGAAASAAGVAAAGDSLTLKAQADTGYVVAAVLVTDAGGTRPAVLTAGALGGNAVTAQLVMPAGDFKATVIFGEEHSVSPPDPDGYALTILADDPDNLNGTANNTAQVFVNGTARTPAARKGAAAMFPVQAGDSVVIKAAADADYSISGAAVGPASLGVTPIRQGSGEFAFVMPAADAAATVSFRKAAVQAYTVDLIVRGTGTGTGTFGAYGTKVYSLSAAAGTPITANLFAAAGSYIQSVSVTPAALGVKTSFTGAFARQEASFVMPAANCILNVTLAQGWPDSVAYNAVLSVSDPTGSADNKAMLTNATRYATTGYLSGVTRGAITGQEYAVMEAEVDSAAGFLPEVSVTDSAGKRLAYTWKSQNVLSFAMPADHVTVDVVYRRMTPGDYTVTLHASGEAGDAVRIEDFNTHSEINWSGPGDSAILDQMTVKSGAPIIVDARAGADRYVKASLVMCGGQLIAYQSPYIGAGGPLQYDYFIMPEGDVDIYLDFAAGTAEPDAHTAALAVTADEGNAGSGIIADVTDPANPGAAVTVPAKGISHITVAPDGRVQVKAAPNADYTVTDIRLTPVGSSISQSVPFTWTDSDQVEFTMPAQDVAVEAVLEKNAAPAYRAQIVVNGSISGDPATPAGTAVLRAGPTDPGGAVLAGVAPGTSLEGVITVNPGYIIKSILVVPQLSGGDLTPDANANQNQVVPFVMPANDVIVYVDFGIDPAAVYTANLAVSHAAGSGVSADNKAAISSPRQTVPGIADMNTSAAAPAAAGETVTVTFSSAPGYGVDSYTVTDADGNAVNCTAVYGGFTFVMPAGNANVSVVYTNQAPTARTAVLHVTDNTSVTSDALKVEISDGPANTVAWTQGAGDQRLITAAARAVTVTATLPADTYVAAAYALQNGQVYPFTMPATPEAGTAAGQFFMPSGDVDVYVELASTTVVPPQDYAALLMVNGPAGKNVGDAGSATLSLDGSDVGVTVQSGGPHRYISALPGSTFTVTVTVNSGYVIDTVSGTGTTVAAGANPNEYTFTLPAANAGAIVTLKESASTGKDLTLHVGHTNGSAVDSANSAKVSYTDAASATTFSKSVTAADGSGVMGAVPSGMSVTLTVTPRAGYYVDAAYALNGTTLVQLSKALEGTTSTDAASFTMPAAATDVYVFYKQGTPAGSWYNVIFMATDVDANGNTTNSGSSKATIAVDGGAAATVTSNASPVQFSNVAAGKSVALQAQAGQGYGFASVTATPALTFSPASDPAKTDYSFTMPANNVAVVMAFQPGTVTADLKLSVEDADNSGTDRNIAEVTLAGNLTGTPDLRVISTGDTGGSAVKTDVASGTAAALKVTPAAGYTPWAEFKTTPAGGTLQTTLVPLAAGAGGTYTGAFTTAATAGELAVHMLKAPKVVLLVRHASGVTVDTGNSVTLSYGAVPPLTATSANAGGAAGVSLPIPGGTAGVQLQVAPAAGYQPVSVTVQDSLGRDITLSGDNLGDATGSDPKTAAFTMPASPDEVVTVTVTFGGEITARKLDMELLRDDTLAAHGSVRIDWDTQSATLNDVNLAASFAAVNIGDTVTVTTAPDGGYRVKLKLESTDSAGNPVLTYLTPDASGAASFTMPGRDAKLTVQYLKGYTATLVLNDTSTGKDSTAKMTADNGLPPLEVQVNYTAPTAKVQEIPGGTAIHVTPTTASGSRNIGVLVTEDESGSTRYLTGMDSVYNYTVNSDVTVTVFVEDDSSDAYLAAVELKGDRGVLGNGASVANNTDVSAVHDPIWTKAKANDNIELTVSLASGYYASISAETVNGNVPVKLLNVNDETRATLTESGVCHFAMPADSVAITVTYFNKDYIAQLFVMDNTTFNNSAAISYTDRYGQLQKVDYDLGVLVGIQKGNTVTAEAVPADAAGVSVGVVANSQKNGASLAGKGADNKYAFEMPADNVAVSTVFDLSSEKLRIAAMRLVARDSLGGGGELDISTTLNTASMKNLTPPPAATRTGRAAAPYTLTLNDGYNSTWVTGYAGDVIEISFQSETVAGGGTRDFYTEVTAETAETLVPVPVLQQGSLGAGIARFIMPDKNVQATVTFDTKAPTPGAQNDLDMLVTDHEGFVDNYTSLTDGTNTLLLTPTAGNTANLTGKLAAVPANTRLGLTTHADGKYRVEYARLSAVVDGVMLILPLTLDANGLSNFQMPAMPATLTVKFATNFSATLHLSPNSVGSVSMAANPGTPSSVHTDGGKIEGIPTGTAVKTTAPANDNGGPLRAVLATTAGMGSAYLTEAGGTWDFIVQDEDVDITAVYDNADAADPDRYVAAVAQSYRAGSVPNASNVTAVSASTAGLAQGSIWTEAQAGDTVTVDVTLAPGYSAVVTAKDTGGTVLDLTYRGRTGREAKVTAAGTVTLTMPAGVNVQISVEFVEGYTVTLSVPDTNPATGTYSVTATDRSTTPPTVGGPIVNDGEQIKGLKGGEAVSAEVTTDADNEVSAVVITKSSGSVLAAAPAGSATDYTYTMPAEDITVTPIVSAKTADLYIAAVDSVGSSTFDDAVTGIINTAERTLPKGGVWAAGKEGHQMEVDFTTGTGVYARVTAKTEGGTEIPVLQLGVTGSGKAYFVMPAANVQVLVTYSADPFAPVAASLVSTGHKGKAENLATVTYDSTEHLLTPASEADVEAQIAAVQPGNPLSMKVQRHPTFSVKAVELSLTGVAGGPVVSVTLDTMGLATVLVPTVAATLTFVYDPTPPTPQPWDTNGAADATVTPNLLEGHLTAVNHDTLADTVNVMVPVLRGLDESGQPKYQHTRIDINGNGTADADDFFAVFRFYYEKDGAITELVPGTDIVLSDPVDYTETTTIDTVNYISAKFTLTGLSDDIKKLISDGGVIYITATQQKNAGETADHPESDKTQLILPGPGFGPRPYDPGNSAEAGVPVLKEGYIYAANYGDRAELTVPVLTDHKNSWSDAYSTGDREVEFRFYVLTGTDAGGEPVYEQLMTESIPDGSGGTIPADIVLDFAADPVETPDPGGAGAGYQGARLTLSLAEGHTSTGARALAYMLDNNSSIDGTDKLTRLFVTAVVVDKTDPNAPKAGPESDKTEVWLPKYMTLSGKLLSYAPTHEATLALHPFKAGGADESLPESYDETAAETIRIKDETGTGLWSQSFVFKSSELVPRGGTSAAYMLTVVKTAHIPYQRVNLVLDTTGGTADFEITDEIRLIGGDVNCDGQSKDDDRNVLMRYMMNDKPWSSDANDTGTDWSISVFNPDAPAYACDLDGDGRISAADLNIQMAEENYNRTAADYGAPSGLSFTPAAAAVLELEEAPPTVPEAPEEAVPQPPEDVQQEPEPPAGDDPLIEEVRPPLEDNPAALPEEQGPATVMDFPKKGKDDEGFTNT